MRQEDVFRMIQRRAAKAKVKTAIGCHSFRALGITTYLENGGTLEKAQQMAGSMSRHAQRSSMIGQPIK